MVSSLVFLLLLLFSYLHAHIFKALSQLGFLFLSYHCVRIIFSNLGFYPFFLQLNYTTEILKLFLEIKTKLVHERSDKTEEFIG